MVAGVNIAVMFDDRDIAASWAKEAKGMVLAEGGAGGFFEDLYLDFTDAVGQPLIEDGTQEGAEGFSRNRTITDVSIGKAFHQRQKTEIPCADGKEKMIYLQGEEDILVIDNTENIDRQFGAHKAGIAAHDISVCPAALPCSAVKIMEFCRAVKA